MDPDEDSRPELLIGLLTLQVAGAERMALELARAFAEDYRIRVATIRDRSHRPSVLPEGTSVGGLKDLLFAHADVLHTHLFLPGLVARIRRIWDRRTPWVHTVHYHNYEAIRWGGLKRWLDHRWIFPEADEVVAVSSSVADTLEHLPQLRTIWNAVHLPRPSDARTPPRTRPSKGRPEGTGGLVVGTVAMLRPEKGLLDLLDAASLLRRRVPALQLRIAGEGPLRSELERRILRLGLTDTVELCGYVEEIHEFYRSLDIYVQPSEREPFGIAALEAFAFELPLVVSEAGFLPTLAGQGRFGRLVRRGPDFAKQLAKALEDVSTSDERWRSRSAEGLRHWQERLRPERMVAEYRRLYSDLRSPGVCMLAPVVTEATGGLQRQLELQTRALARLGWRVQILQRGPKDLLRDPTLRKRWTHARFLLTPPPRTRRAGPLRLLERARGVLYVVSALRLVIRHRHRIGILHAHQLYSPTLAGALANAVVKLPLVSKVTASGALGEAAELDRLPFKGLRRWAFGRVDRVIVLHSAMVQEVGDIGFPEDRIVEIPNAVEVPEKPVSLLPLATEEPLRLLFVGRLSTEKGLELLLEAAGIVAGGGEAVRVDLVGEGDPDRNAEPKLRRLAKRLEARTGSRGSEGDPGASLDIRFHGRQDDVEACYRMGSVFVLPSRSEGMSNALLEAMAWGLPCVVSDIPSNRALVEDAVTGLLFPDGHPRALADVLVEVARDRRREGGRRIRQLGANARRAVEESYSVDAVGRKIDRLYRTLLGV